MVRARDRQVGKSFRHRIGRTASSAQRIRRTVARQSENVGSDFLYQAAPSTDSFPVFAASSEAHRVTSENSPNKSGVVRWIAKSDHWRCARPRDGAGPLQRSPHPPIASRTRSGSPTLTSAVGADEDARLGVPSRVPGQHPAHRHGNAVRVPQGCSSRHIDWPIYRVILGPPSRNGHAYPLGGLPDRPGPWRQLTGADNARPPLFVLPCALAVD